MLPNKLKGAELEWFLSIYKTVLHAYISSSKDKSNIDINDAIDNATCIAMISVDNMFDDNGNIKHTDDIIESVRDKRVDRPVEYPNIKKNNN